MPQALKRLDGHSIDVNRPEAAAGRTAVNQPSIAAAFQTVSAKANEAELKAALVYCMNPAVPFRLAGDGYFLQANGKPISRLKIPVQHCAKGLQTKGQRDPFKGESKAFSRAVLPSDRLTAERRCHVCASISRSPFTPSPHSSFCC